ncbi:GM11315 [Drosophila sechellia]|uniref:GM11315 n=1 Tax=Drosophila sechellia TaxID=7238 RepID=B4IDQ5_DROSE|nr:GM11315 [Drosophila sechellia]
MSDKQQEKEPIPDEEQQQEQEHEAPGSRHACCGSGPDPEPEVEMDVEVEEASGSAIGAAAAGGSDAPAPANPNPGLERDRDRDSHGDRSTHRDEFGTQRVYKKTSPNCVLTLYLPTREITLTGNNPSVLRGIVYVDPKAIQGYRVYAQLTLTFRYGREDEEVMGLRFCNEAIMSLHQIWPRLEEPTPESLSPLQEALMKRLGDGAHPFTLSLSSYAPPSVQLVPAKRYYGAPIGTSYDVRCFIADKTDEKFHRRASVKMGVRVIYRTDVFHQHLAPEQYAAFAGRQNNAQSPPASATPPSCGEGGEQHTTHTHQQSQSQPTSGSKHKTKSERGDSFPKLRLSPKSFRFSGRFGRSKSEIEKCPNDPFHSYSKSFQEHCDSMLPPHTGAGVTGGIGGVSVGPCGGPQGSVDKPFLLHDGRVGLRASLDKGWYTHGEDVQVTVNIRNDSRKTVRKVRVCAIQHVDVCMFNNGKFKNVVADSDNVTPPVDRTVAAGASLNTTLTLRPQRGSHQELYRPGGHIAAEHRAGGDHWRHRCFGHPLASLCDAERPAVGRLRPSVGQSGPGYPTSTPLAAGLARSGSAG